MFLKLPRKACFLGAGLAFLAVLVLLMASKREFDRQVPLVEFAVQPDNYGSTITQTQSFAISPEASSTIWTLEAPVDQSWIFLKCKVVAPDGTTAAEFPLQVSYYHGFKNGQPWHTGVQTARRRVAVQPGSSYRLRVEAEYGEGEQRIGTATARGPLARITVQTGLGSARAWTWSTAAAAAIGIWLLVRGFAGSPSEVAACQRLDDTVKPRFVFLDGLRGVAVLAVLYCHLFVPELSSAGPYLSKALPPFFGAIAPYGALGVEIFFVLSGFVIAHSLGDEKVTVGYATRFIARRALRLDPPYYIALLLMLAIVAAYLPDGLFGAWQKFGGWPGILSNLFYLQNLLLMPTPLDISWTLCLEIQFYLALMACRFVSSRLPQGRIDRLLVFVIPLWVISVVCWYPHLNRFDFIGTWFRFGLGVLTYLAFRKRMPLWCWYVPILVVVILSIMFRDTRGAVAASTGLAILLAGNLGKMGSWLVNRPIQFIGRLSYSLYLFHLAAGIVVANAIWDRMKPTPQNALLVSCIGFVSAIAGAWLMHHLFEKPAVRLSHRMK